METQAKLDIQKRIREGQFELVSSFVLIYEISKSPNIVSAQSIRRFVENFSSVYVSDSKLTKIEAIAEKIQETGIKKMDSWHVACAVMADADYFLTTDKRLLKYKSDTVKMMNPIDFIAEMEE